MNAKIIYSVFIALIIVAINEIIMSDAQISTTAYDYGYPGLWGYYGYHGYGNPYNYYYSSHPIAAATTSQGSANPIASASGGITANVLCANCGFGRN